MKKQIAEAKTNIFLDSARSFVNISPHFRVIMYTMNFNKVTIIKILDIRIELLIHNLLP